MARLTTAVRVEKGDCGLNYDEAKTNANAISGKLSDVARHLAFAGVAIIWVFSGGGTEKVEDVQLDDFRWTLYVFALALALDFAHYCWQSWYMRELVRDHEEELKGPGKGYQKTRVRWTGRLFVAKLSATALGYLLLLVQIGLNI